MSVGLGFCRVYGTMLILNFRLFPLNKLRDELVLFRIAGIPESVHETIPIL